MVSPNELNQLNDVVVTTIVSLISDKLVDLSGKSNMVLYLTPRDFKKEVKDKCGLAPTILELKAAEAVCKENGWKYTNLNMHTMVVSDDKPKEINAAVYLREQYGL